MARVSIAMATYNGERYLKEQIESILVQTIQDFELVVSDDCSLDNTVKIIHEYMEKDGRIKLFINEKNLGFKENFERTLAFCTGEYIALCDQDDIWTENHVEVLLNNIGKNDLVCGDAYLVDENKNYLGSTLFGCSKIDFLPHNKEAWFRFLMHGSIIQGAACMFKSELISKIVPMPKGVKYHDYWIAVLAAENNGIHYTKEAVLFYRQHGNNITTNEKWNFINKIKRAFDRAYRIKKTKEQILFLQELENKVSEQELLVVVKSALVYYMQSLSYMKNLLSSRYFLLNYRSMYLSRDPYIFFIRYMKRFILFM